MAKPKVYVVYGLGIGCHKEVAKAFELAGGKPEIVHIRELLLGRKKLFDSQIINWSGGFLHGDMGGAGMYAANELEHAIIDLGEDGEKRLKDMLIEYAEKGNVVYGQCNGFQLLVRTGLLPGINGDYSKQTVTLAGNACGNYWVAPVMHKVEMPDHFAFKGVGDYLRIWCRHGEGKLMFWSEHGLVSEAEGEANRKAVNANHVLLRYVHPKTLEAATTFHASPNCSVDGIGGLVDPTGNIIGHMGHTEVSVYSPTDADWYARKDKLRRQGVKAEQLEGKLIEGSCLPIFKNLVGRFE